MSFLMEDPDVGRSFMSKKTVGLWEGLALTCFFLRTESCFLAGLVEDMNDRTMSETALRSPAHGQTAA